MIVTKHDYILLRFFSNFYANIFNYIFCFYIIKFRIPGYCKFCRWFLILAGILNYSNVIVILSTFAMVLSLIYSLFLYNRIFSGCLQELFIRYYSDCTRLEFWVLLIFSFLLLPLAYIPWLFYHYVYLHYQKFQLLFFNLCKI